MAIGHHLAVTAAHRSSFTSRGERERDLCLSKDPHHNAVVSGRMSPATYGNVGKGLSFLERTQLNDYHTLTTLPNKTTGCTYKVILRRSPKREWGGLGAASLSSLLDFPLK